MTRGKYAAKAANKRATAEVEASETAYRRQIVRLTEERDQARAERDSARTDWAKEARILRAQLSEGTSPRVEALTRELNRVREERDELQRIRREVQSRYAAATGRLREHMVAEHGMSPATAMDAAYSLIVGEYKVITQGIEKRTGDAFGPDAVIAIRKARGL